MIKFLKFMIISLLFFTSTSCSDETQSVAENSASKLTISAATNTELRQTYTIEIADTKEKLYNGLMGRTSLDENTGLLFDISIVPQDVDIAFWMKDTLIPLDVIFIDEDGTIFFIYENAQPNDTTPIFPPKRPRAVLEVNGGQVAQYGIRVDDIVTAEMFKNK